MLKPSKGIDGNLSPQATQLLKNVGENLDGDFDPNDPFKKWNSIVPKLMMTIYFEDDCEDEIALLNQISAYVREHNDFESFMKLLLENGFVENVGAMMKESIENIFDDPLTSKLYKASKFLAHCSENSLEMCQTLVSKKFHKSVVQKLSSLTSQVKFLDGSHETEKISELVFNLLTITYNMARKLPECKQEIRDVGIVDVSLAFLEAAHPVIKAHAFSVLATVADISSNDDVIKATSTNMKFVLDSLLRPAMNSSRHNSENELEKSSTLGRKIEEVMENLSTLSKNTNNAEEMANHGIINDYENLLGGQNVTETELKLTLNTIWSLSFHEDLRDQLKKKNISTKVNQWKNHENIDIKHAVAGIQWNLRENNFRETASKFPGNPDNHVMISYSQRQQALVWQLWRKLKQRGIKVWIDTEKMQGDMFDKMGKAVQNASHVICCVSEDYFNSDPCRSEAQYSRELKRKMIFVKVQKGYRPKDWLGLIMAGKIYYEMHSSEEIEKNFGRLFSYLQGKMVPGETVAELEKKASHQKEKRKPENRVEVPCNWTQDDVSKWFLSIGCSNGRKSRRVIRGMDGEMLNQLCSWQKNAPHFFLTFAQQQLGLNPLDLMKFGNAVEKLNAMKSQSNSTE